MNQIGLVVAIFVYSIWGIYDALTGPGAYAEQIAAGGQVAEMLQPIDDLTRAVTIGVCITLMFGSAVGQGCTALYYVTRRKHMVRFLEATPSWVVETIRV